MAQLSALLTVRRELAWSEYSFSYTDWQHNYSRSWIAGLTSGETEHLRACLDRWRVQPGPDEVLQVQEVLNQLFPAELLEFLEQSLPPSLAIVSDEADLPWEWVGPVGRPLFTGCEVTRDLAQRPSSSALAQSAPVFGLIGDSLSSRMGVDDDLRQVASCLGSSGQVIDAGSPVQALVGDRFALLHLACPGLEALHFGGSRLLPDFVSEGQRTGARFVFFHLYGSPAQPGPPLLELANRWAATLFGVGGEAFLVNLWAGAAEDQRIFCEAFYGRLASGSTLGEAVLAGRHVLLQRRSPLAFAYYLYGNPQLRLDDLRPMQVRESTTVPGGLSTSVQLRVLNGVEEGRVIPLFTSALRQRGLILGSSGPRACDVELDEQVPNQTASLALADETLVLTNLTGDRSLVLVNGLPVQGTIALSGWEKLSLAGVEIQVEPTQASALAAAVPRAFCLEVHDGERSRTEWFEEDLLTLGRGQSARIPFGDQAVSRNHALIQRSGDTLMVSRLGQNVVAVNGVPAQGAQELNQGDLIQLTDRAFFRVLRIVN